MDVVEEEVKQIGEIEETLSLDISSDSNNNKPSSNNEKNVGLKLDVQIASEETQHFEEPTNEQQVENNKNINEPTSILEEDHHIVVEELPVAVLQQVEITGTYTNNNNSEINNGDQQANEQKKNNIMEEEKKRRLLELIELEKQKRILELEHQRRILELQQMIEKRRKSELVENKMQDTLLSLLTKERQTNIKERKYTSEIKELFEIPFKYLRDKNIESETELSILLSSIEKLTPTINQLFQSNNYENIIEFLAQSCGYILFRLTEDEQLDFIARLSINQPINLIVIFFDYIDISSTLLLKLFTICTTSTRSIEQLKRLGEIIGFYIHHINVENFSNEANNHANFFDFLDVLFDGYIIFFRALLNYSNYLHLIHPTLLQYLFQSSNLIVVTNENDQEDNNNHESLVISYPYYYSRLFKLLAVLLKIISFKNEDINNSNTELYDTVAQLFARLQYQSLYQFFNVEFIDHRLYLSCYELFYRILEIICCYHFAYYDRDFQEIIKYHWTVVEKSTNDVNHREMEFLQSLARKNLEFYLKTFANARDVLLNIIGQPSIFALDVYSLMNK